MKVRPPAPTQPQEATQQRFRAGLPERKNGPELAKPLVGVAGFEPTTSSSRTKRATKLRYTPWCDEQ